MVWDARLDPTTIHWQNFVVAEDAAKPNRPIIGIAQIRPYRDCREFGSLTVLPDYRRQGIGQQLLETLLAQEKGNIYLDCVRAKVAYYSRFGFRVIPFNERPFTLKLKSLGSLLLRPFGIQVVTMKRISTHSSRRSAQ